MAFDCRRCGILFNTMKPCRIQQYVASIDTMGYKYIWKFVSMGFDEPEIKYILSGASLTYYLTNTYHWYWRLGSFAENL